MSEGQEQITIHVTLPSGEETKIVKVNKVNAVLWSVKHCRIAQ